jgi:hypothetical protein
MKGWVKKVGSHKPSKYALKMSQNISLKMMQIRIPVVLKSFYNLFQSLKLTRLQIMACFKHMPQCYLV